MIKKVLTIAGSDCIGGAGIQADIKTIMAHKMYGMSAITALTSENTMGVYGIMEATPESVASQIDCVFNDIRPDAVKIGMVVNSEIINVVAEKLIEHKAENIVLDPVMVATSGGKLISDDAMDSMLSKLIPLATVITPNIPETEVILGRPIKNEKDMEQAGKEINEKQKCAVLVKGGHLVNDAVDYLYNNGKGSWFVSERINNPNTHGTGCTLSSAIACNLANGFTLEESIKNAKDYLTGALRANLDLGHGAGPLHHGYNL